MVLNCQKWPYGGVLQYGGRMVHRVFSSCCFLTLLKIFNHKIFLFDFATKYIILIYSMPYSPPSPRDLHSGPSADGRVVGSGSSSAAAGWQPGSARQGSRTGMGRSGRLLSNQGFMLVFFASPLIFSYILTNSPIICCSF